MKTLIVSIHDTATQAFGRPVFTHSSGQAIRSFTDEVNREDAGSDLYKHPDDFTLYLLGEFDDSTGHMQSLATPSVLIRGKDARITKA